MKRPRGASDGEDSFDESGSVVVVHQSQVEPTTPTPSGPSPTEDDVDNSDDQKHCMSDSEDQHTPAANVSDGYVAFDGDDTSVILPSPSPSPSPVEIRHDNVVSSHQNLDTVPADMLALVPLVQQGDGDAAAGPAPSQSSDADTDDTDDDETEEMGASVFEGDPYTADGANMFGFHYCPQCVAFATCDICHAVHRTERLLHIDDADAQTPDHVYGFPPRGMHGCTHCRMVGVCDICGFYFRDVRHRPLRQMPRSF